MRNIWLIVLLISILPAPASCAEGVAGRWTAVQGRVSVTRVGTEASRQARPEDALVVGDLLEAGADSRAQALLTDDSVVKLSPGTALRILQYSFEPASGRRTAVVKVVKGQVRLIVAARKNSRFNVESPQAGMAVAAADFVAMVSVAETTIAVLEGSVRVKNISNLVVSEIDLWSNQSTVVREKSAPDHPVQITPVQRRRYRNDARDSRP